MNDLVKLASELPKRVPRKHWKIWIYRFISSKLVLLMLFECDGPLHFHNIKHQFKNMLIAWSRIEPIFGKSIGPKLSHHQKFTLAQCKTYFLHIRELTFVIWVEHNILHSSKNRFNAWLIIKANQAKAMKFYWVVTKKLFFFRSNLLFN